MDDEPLNLTDRKSLPRPPRDPLLGRLESMRDGLGRGAEAHDIARAIAVLHASHQQCAMDPNAPHAFPEGCPLFAAWEARRPR